MSTQIQLAEIKPTSQEIEQALINIIKAGLYYRRPKEYTIPLILLAIFSHRK